MIDNTKEGFVVIIAFLIIVAVLIVDQRVRIYVPKDENVYCNYKQICITPVPSITPER